MGELEAAIPIGADLKPLDRDLASARQKVQRWAQQVEDVGRRMFIAGSAVLAGLGLATKFASDFEETASKFKTVFKEQADAAQDWADAYADAVGRSRTQLMGFLAQAQDTFVPLGYAREEARKLSQQIVQLTTDIASFNNQADADVMRDLMSALVGNHETVRKYGIIIDEARLKQEALNHSMDPSALTQQQKAHLRLQLIVKGSTDAIGDAERTSGSFANRMKALKAQLEEVAVAIGSALLPVVTPLVEKIATIAMKVANWVKDNQTLIKVAASVAAALSALGAVVWTIAKAYAALAAIQAMANPIKAMIGLAAAATTAAAAYGILHAAEKDINNDKQQLVETESRFADALRDSANAAKEQSDALKKMPERVTPTGPGFLGGGGLRGSGSRAGNIRQELARVVAEIRTMPAAQLPQFAGSYASQNLTRTQAFQDQQIDEAQRTRIDQLRVLEEQRDALQQLLARVEDSEEAGVPIQR